MSNLSQEFFEAEYAGLNDEAASQSGPQPIGTPSTEIQAAGQPIEIVRETGEHVITDDLDLLLATLPVEVVGSLRATENRANLLEVVLDLGRRPEARFRGGEFFLTQDDVTTADIEYVTERIGEFGGDNRAGIERTLHRISCIRNRRGSVVGLTCRIGRAVFGTISIIKDLVETGQSILLVGAPGVGKTTLLRECARVLADEVGKRVVIVDTSNEIAGDGDIPHPAIGRARRMQVPMPERQHAVMIEAVENHMPEVIIIDEIGTELEAQAARTIAERGVQLVGTAHGTSLENLMLNPTLSDLVGGIQTVTLGDDEARRRGTQKSVLERKAPPTFDIIVEILDRERVAVHRDVAETVDSLLRGEIIPPEIRTRLADGSIHTEMSQVSPQPNGRQRPEMSRGGTGGGRGGYDSRSSYSGFGGLPNAPRRQMPAQPTAMPGERLSGTRTRGVNGGGAIPFAGARGGEGFAPARDRGQAQESVDYDAPGTDEERDRERTIQMGAGAMRVAATASSNKPLQVYPFGVSRNRLEQAIKQLRVPATMVREIGDADMVMTLKNYYRKNAQPLRQAEAEGRPVYVLKSNTLLQIQNALAGVFDVPTPPTDPVTGAMEETEDAIGEVLESARTIDLAPQAAHIRKIQHQMAERYNLGSVSRGKEPFRRVRIFRQD